MSSTLWAKGPGQAPLYSDWSVSFTTTGGSGLACKDHKKQDDGSVSTTSLSSEESVDTDQSSPDNNKDQLQDELPDESSSDKSEDQSQDEQQQGEIFSVHRNMIGPKSVFFTQSFLGEQNTESNNSSVVELPSDLPSHTFASVVEAFELLLGYCYNANESFVPEDHLTTKNAVAMYCLCKYFKMDSEICEKVHDFIKSDLSHDTVAKYYQIVKDMQSAIKTPSVLDAEQIMEMVVIMCHQSPSVLDNQTDLFKIADLSLWLPVGSLLANDDDIDAKPSSIDTSKVWSENITSFFDTYHEEDVISLKESFRILTSEKILPEVSSKVALRLLEHERKHNLHSLTRLVKKAKDIDDDGLSHATSNISDDDTISTTYDSDSDEVLEEDLIGTSTLTNLQQRCIKALSDSSWSGEENNAEQKRGKLIDITTPSVLEALLINSVTGERELSAKMEKLNMELGKRKTALAHEIELFEFKQEEAKYVVAKEKQKQQSLQHQLDNTRKECESAQRKLKKIEGRVEQDKSELCKANALLEAELEEEKEKSHSLNSRLREIETAQFKVDSDREMFELTIKETIKQLDAITSCDEAYGGACGLGHLILLISAIGDRGECDQIKCMLQQVIKDPQTYERDYLHHHKSVACDDSFLTLTNDDP